MAIEWIVIEVFAVIVENYVKVYFIISQIKSKYKPLSVAALITISVVWGLIATFLNFNQFVYNSVDFIR